MSFNAPFFLAWLLTFFFGTAIHSFVQAWLADRFGDRKPRSQGRVRLSPSVHHEPLGLLLAFVFSLGQPMIAWGKPLEINTYALRGGRTSRAIIAAIGPIVYVLLAFLIWLATKSYIGNSAATVVGTNADTIRLDFLSRFFLSLVLANLFMCAFSVIPLAPLDGWYFLRSVLPRQWDEKIEPGERWGPTIILVLITLIPFVLAGFNPLFSLVIVPIVRALSQLITGVSLI